MTSGGCISEPDAHRERRAARPGRRAPALTAGPLPARAGARKAAGGGGLKRKGGFVQNGGFVPDAPPHFRKTARIHVFTSVPCCVCMFQRPFRTRNRATARSALAVAWTGCGLRLWSSPVWNLPPAQLLSWLARAHPSNPVCPRPSVKCRCPRVAAATEGRQEVHRAAPGSHTRAHAHEA